MKNQGTLFDAAAGARQRDEAIHNVGKGRQRFIVLGIESIRKLCADVDAAFTTDEVWYLLDRDSVAVPSEPRAMGALMKAAQKAGLIEPTREWRLSKRPACHRRPVRVWKAT